jgi:putative phosphoribosyl transferase
MRMTGRSPDAQNQRRDYATTARVRKYSRSAVAHSVKSAGRGGRALAQYLLFEFLLAANRHGVMFRPYSKAQRPFADRRQAGEVLATHLAYLAGRDDVVVLALPRGGVPVGEVARALGAELDVFVVRKLGFPGQPELAMGAIASGDVRVLNDELLASYPVASAAIEAVTRSERLELERRERLYRGNAPRTPLDGRIVVLVDDGLATGSTMRAAVLAVRRLGPVSVIVAVPVGARDTCEALRQIADAVVCVTTPEPFGAVGLWYADFAETTDDEVRRLLVTRPRAAATATPRGAGE